MKKVVCILLCSLLLLTSCTAAEPSVSSEEPSSQAVSEEQSEACSEEPSASASEEASSPVSQEASEEQSEADTFANFLPVFRMAVSSDTHVSSPNDRNASRLKKLFESAYKYSSSQEYNTLDAVIFAGDITNNGYKYEFDAFKSVLKTAVKEGTAVITVMGNHEYYGGGQSVYLANMDDKLNKHVVVNGFHIIGISPSNGESYDTATLNFLKDSLEEANDADSEKPIFTFQHHHIKNTVYVSSEWYTSSSPSLNAAFSKYPQVINFSGHSHGPVNIPTSMWQGKYTALGTGTLHYFEMTSGMSYGTVPPKSENAAQYYIIEVDAENRVRILPYNILTNDFFRTPSNADDDGEQLIYYIDKPSDSNTFRYKNRDKTAEKPYFAEGAALKISDIREKSAKLTIPQAIDKQCMYSYEIVCKSEKQTKTFNYFAEYYFEPLAKEQTFDLTSLSQNTEYQVSVYPVNCFGKKGDAITLKFTTQKGEEVVYRSENPVNYYGTFTNFDSITQLRLAKNTFAYGGKIDGDVFVGDWSSANKDSSCSAESAEGKGFEGSAALEIRSSNKNNHGLYIFADSVNKNSTKYPDPAYLRIWVDFTDVSFRKANFGLVSSFGGLFTTDEGDGRTNQKFWYLAEGQAEWKQYTHGSDGCFGEEQGSSVKGFKGWMAFPVSDFLYRGGTGTQTEASLSPFPYQEAVGVYMFWDYSDNGVYTNKSFYLDEVQLVPDYTVFGK